MPLTLTAVSGPSDTSCIERQLRRTSISIVQVSKPQSTACSSTLRHVLTDSDCCRSQNKGKAWPKGHSVNLWRTAPQAPSLFKDPLARTAAFKGQSPPCPTRPYQRLLWQT